MLDLVMVARRLRKAGRELTLRGAQPDISVLIEYVGLHRLPGVSIAPAPAPGLTPPRRCRRAARSRWRSLHLTMALLLVVLFIVVPIAELYVLIQIGQAIGILPTIALLILDSILGAALMRSQGRAAWMRFNRALAEGRVPGREVIDGALVIFGGALLLTPGFLSDILGLILLLPPTRALVRTVLCARFAGRIVASAASGAQARMGRMFTFEAASGRAPAPAPARRRRLGVRRRRRRGHGAPTVPPQPRELP